MTGDDASSRKVAQLDQASKEVAGSKIPLPTAFQAEEHLVQQYLLHVACTVSTEKRLHLLFMTIISFCFSYSGKRTTGGY